MSLLQWDSSFGIGIDGIDADHRRLFQQINESWKIIQGKGRQDDVLGAVSRLYDNMEGHFQREEKYLGRLGWLRARAHKRQHRQMLDYLRRMITRIQAGGAHDADGAALDFIGHWFSNHILESDAQYAGTRQAAKTDWSQLWPIMVMGICVSLLMFWGIWEIERSREEARFTELADQRLNTVRINANTALDSLRMLATHFEVSDPGHTSREDFTRLVSPLLGRYPFIQALEWVPQVSKSERVAYEMMAHRDGLSNFRISEKDAAGQAVAAGDRTFYYPVFYVEPIKGNEKALGFDLSSNPARNHALTIARQTGQLVASARVVLIQENGNQYGTLIFSPVFSNALEHRGGLLGYVLGVFRIGDFIESSNADSSIALHVYDLSSSAEDGSLLYPRATEVAPENLLSGWSAVIDLDVAGRTWRVIATPGAGYHRSLMPMNAVLAMLAALLVTAFLTARQKNAIERLQSGARFAREITRSQQRLSEAHRIARLGYVEFDPITRRWAVGDGTQEMLGLPEDCHSGSTSQVFTAIHEEDRRKLRASLDSIGSSDLDIELRVGDRVLSATAERLEETVLRSPKVLTLQDITLRRASEKEREMMLTRMAEAGRLESLGSLAGGVAHEINTPAQFISDNLAFLRDWMPRVLGVVAEARKAVETKELAPLAEHLKGFKYDFAARELPAAAEQGLAGISRISSIVQAIKEFSYPSSSTPQLFDLNHAIELAVTVSRNQWKYVAEMSLDLTPGLSQVNGVEGEINQILVNLIVNAAQAIEQRGATGLGRIIVSTRTQGEMVEFSVADTGVGIPRDSLERIFELFYTTKPPGQGTGQGLAISKAIVMRHGGTIVVTSEEGVGSRFTISLPLKGKPVASEDEE